MADVIASEPLRAFSFSLPWKIYWNYNHPRPLLSFISVTMHCILVSVVMDDERVRLKSKNKQCRGVLSLMKSLIVRLRKTPIASNRLAYIAVFFSQVPFVYSLYVKRKQHADIHAGLSTRVRDHCPPYRGPTPKIRWMFFFFCAERINN